MTINEGGCSVSGLLFRRTRILMPDYSWVEIARLVAEGFHGEVLGRGESGDIGPVQVLDVTSGVPADPWTRMEVSRRGIGRGSASGALVATNGSGVWSPTHSLAGDDGFISAVNLRVGDEMWLHRSEVSLPPMARQVLIGKMLGDASIVRSSICSASVAWGHRVQHRDYVAWTNQMLGPELCNGRIDERYTSGYGTAMARSKTASSCLIFDLFKDWLTLEGKQVPESAIREIGPIALAFWYMDEGSLAHDPGQEDRACFATCGFDERSVDRLVRALDRNGVTGAVKYRSNGWRIRLNCDAAECLFLLIAPYIPETMQYKLPERYRSGVAGFPRTFGRYKSLVRPQTVRLVETAGTVSEAAHGRRLDTWRNVGFGLETSSHNFFANGMLVHDSTIIASESGGNRSERARH
jgi:hypothetical protein